MPCDDCLWFNDDESRAPARPEAQEPNPKESVRGSESGPAGNGAPEDVDLTSQGEDLSLKRKARPKAGEDS
jgi:hypothetical protein